MRRSVAVAALCAVLLFAGCGSDNGGGETTETIPTIQEIAARRGAAPTPPPSDTLPAETTVGDNNVFTQALKQKDAALCTQIISDFKKRQCREIIEETKDTIALSGQPQPQLQTTPPPTTPQPQIQPQKPAPPPQPETPLTSKTWLIENEALAQQNPDICNRIRFPEKIVPCKYQVSTLMAIQQQNPSQCNAIGDPQYEVYCKNNVKHVTGIEDPTTQHSPQYGSQT